MIRLPLTRDDVDYDFGGDAADDGEKDGSGYQRS